MKRRGFFAGILSAFAGLFVRPATVSATTTRPYPVPATMWFATSGGARRPITPEETRYGFPEMPAGFDYMHFLEARMITETCYGRDGKQVYVGHSTWPVSLVDAMVRSGDYCSDEAALIAGEMCERCMNVAGHRYGLAWGYAEDSPAYRRCNTSCHFCADFMRNPS